jgi:hypothetical protein
MATRKNFNSLKVPRMTDVFPQAVIASAPQVMPFPAGILVSVECIALK